MTSQVVARMLLGSCCGVSGGNKTIAWWLLWVSSRYQVAARLVVLASQVVPRLFIMYFCHQ